MNQFERFDIREILRPTSELFQSDEMGNRRDANDGVRKLAKSDGQLFHERPQRMTYRPGSQTAVRSKTKPGSTDSADSPVGAAISRRSASPA